MKRTHHHEAALLQSRGIRPSHQRISVLSYLEMHRTHPTADMIYRDLHETDPALSRATVYNTLDLFQREGLVRLLNIEDKEKRYDITIRDHGHFKCQECGAIYDFEMEMEDTRPAELAGFEIKDRNVYYKGICPKCRKAKRA